MNDLSWQRTPSLRRLTVCLPFGLVALLGLVPAAHAAAADRQGAAGDEAPRFEGETTVTAVEVPVRVTLHGRPVRGLTAESIRVVDGDVERPVLGFEELDWSAVDGSRPGAPGEASPRRAASGGGGSAEAPRAEAPPSAAERRHFLFLFDLGFTSPADLARAEKAARKVLHDELHPDDRVGVAFYSPGRGAGLVLQFTSDRAAVEAALGRLASYLQGGSLEAAASGGAGSDPLGITVEGWDGALGKVGREEEFGRNDFSHPFGDQPMPGPGRVDESLAENGAAFEQVYREREATRIAWMTDELGALVRRLAEVDGPRYLVFLSGGNDVGLADPMTNWSGSTDPGAGFWLLEQLEDLVDQVWRSGWVIYSVQLGGTSADARHRGSLFHLARETGGELLENFNDPADALGAVLERTSSTYLLTFQVPDLPSDGSYHPIRVELVGAPTGARVSYRPGYRAPRPWSELDPSERRLGAGAALVAGRELDDLAIAVVASTPETDGARRKVPVAIEVGGPSLMGEEADQELALEIYGYAFNPSGEVGGSFARAVVFDLSKVATPVETGGLRWIDELELEPGTWELRVLVRSAASGHRGLRTLRLEVPPPGTELRLLAPFFLAKPADGWLLASGIGGSPGKGAYPFTVGGRRLVPAADPTVAPGSPLRLVLPGVGLDPEHTVLAVRIVDAAGEPVAGARLDWLGREPGSGGQPDVLIGALGIGELGIGEAAADDLPAGEYRLEIALGGEAARRVEARFRVAWPSDEG